ncbi:MAG: hypothetical protein HKO64_03815 [Xanthomonadales bacterium]|nr:hypothetical protein [Xanthomonadales bacterium]
MGNWIKNNLVLVSGIVLPVLLVAGFLVLSHAPRVLTDPPEYDFVMVAYRYDYQHPREYSLNFEVRQGKLYGKAVPLENANTYTNRQHAGIFRYRAAEGSFEEIVYELPESLDDIEETVTFPVQEAADLDLDKRAKSPDGYTFEYLGYRGRGGLLGEMFGMGRRYDSNYVLSKGGANIDLPKPTSNPNYYGHDLHFMGWVSEGSPAS